MESALVLDERADAVDRAALIYQRATSDADRLIAERLSALVDEHRKKGKKAAKKIKKKRRKGDEDGPDGVAVPVA